ncbi:hypothetical protein INR49_011405, partial [Caranx melampygus]
MTGWEESQDTQGEKRWRRWSKNEECLRSTSESSAQSLSLKNLRADEETSVRSCNGSQRQTESVDDVVTSKDSSSEAWA